MTFRHGAILMLAVALMGFAAGARADDNFGAIAYSPTSGADGYSFDYSTQAEAEDHALAECSSRGDGCQSVLWFRNACGALAVGPDGWGSAWGGDRQTAEQSALDQCRDHSGDCSVTRWVCTTR
jgi:uncharacterized protein DUF4189